ncbi:hypothetical protein NQ318_009230 [Aromia moschata]|uniref:Rotatin n=1 Tax=Aromia moschata TaxID=1265417 RepID=A0AAV8YBJ4_9CUCU|nr:hypothetical protein NQ318_009230 [Aromia moschata]
MNIPFSDVHLPQLVYLRNRLWTEIFNLIASLTRHGNREDKFDDRSVEALSVFSRTLVEVGNEPFLETLCESISCLGSNELQNSALTSLTSLLRIEVHRTFEKTKTPDDGVFETASLQTLLDSVRTPRSVVISGTKDNLENSAPLPASTRKTKQTARSLERHKMNLLEEAYFGQVFPTKLDADVPEDFEILLHLYDIYDSKADNKRRACVLAALTGLLGVSKEAKRYALEKGLAQVVVRQLRDFHIRLSLESVDCLRRVGDKRRVCPVLKELDELVGLLTNFMVGDEAVKTEVVSLNLADVIHKLWVWFLAQNAYLVDVLRMLCVYTVECPFACQSLTLTSPVAGSGPRRTPSNVSLLHTIIALIVKEMDQVSKTHSLGILELCFNVLNNCCESLECRVLMSKGNLFQSISRLHPAITKRQKPWEGIELIWLEFLQTFTSHPEGQTSVAKVTDVLELVMTLTSSTRAQNRLAAMLVLRNLAFYQPNRPRLLSSGDFLNILQTKLTSGSREEKNTVVVIMWALANNSQKAKIILKSAHLDSKLQHTIKHSQLVTRSESQFSNEELERMYYVLNMLRDGEKVR